MHLFEKIKSYRKRSKDREWKNFTFTASLPKMTAKTKQQKAGLGHTEAWSFIWVLHMITRTEAAAFSGTQELESQNLNQCPDEMPISPVMPNTPHHNAVPNCVHFHSFHEAQTFLLQLAKLYN